jgi:hypothetical protein
MDVLKQRIWVRRDEVIDALEIKDKNRMRFYSYTYRILNKKGNWNTAIRWDNFEQNPHVDKYESTTDVLLEQKNCREINLMEVIRLVTSFRRNLLVMDVSEL